MKVHTDLTLILGSGGHFTNFIIKLVYDKNNTLWVSNHKVLVNYIFENPTTTANQWLSSKTFHVWGEIRRETTLNKGHPLA